MFNTSRAAIWERADQYGCDTYQVSSHNGARPLCYPWQGKVISRTDMVREVEDLDGNTVHVYAQSETSYGEAAGLFGVNCKHYPMTFIPGFSTLKGEPQDPEENEEEYELSQEQRALERKLREERRDLAVMKAQGAPEAEIKAQRERVKKASQDIDDFCDETGRARRKNREGTPINAKFPDKDSYDPTQFPTAERDRLNDWFKNGGGNPPPSPTNIHLGPDNVPPQGQAQIPAEQKAPESSFVPAKTRQEAEAYAKQHFADIVDYSGMNIDNANKVNETLTELTNKYPINRIDHITQQPLGAVARASFRKLEINGKKLGKVLKEEEMNFQIGQAFAKSNLETMQKRYAGKAKLPFDVQRKIEQLEKDLKFTRYGVHSKYDDHVRVVITHEYGHILSDQYFGMINGEMANPNYNYNWQIREMNEKWKKAYDEATRTGDIYKLSKYGIKNVREFFAESFAAMEMGEEIPEYVESLFREVFANGIM
jgi:hypothetical protein